MRESQLEKMSLKDLLKLQDRISQAIGEKRIAERHDVRQKMEELARQRGFSLSDFFGKGRRSKVAPKYRNPKNPSETWTGRGRRPRWIVEAGGDLNRFLIT